MSGYGYPPPPPQGSGSQTPLKWHHSMCGCFSDWNSCCLGFWCPCILAGQNVEKMGQGGCFAGCCIWFLLSGWGCQVGISSLLNLTSSSIKNGFLSRCLFLQSVLEVISLKKSSTEGGLQLVTRNFLSLPSDPPINTIYLSYVSLRVYREFINVAIALKSPKDMGSSPALARHVVPTRGALDVHSVKMPER